MAAVGSIHSQLLDQGRTEMYFEHFRLTGPPFRSTSASEVVYLSRTHREGLAALEWGVARELNGFTLLTGEPGSGKTTLIYSILQRDFEQVRIAYIVDPKLSFLEILRAILAQLKLYCAESTKLSYVEALGRFLELRRKDERVAIIIDEAQDLSDDALEELRLLSNHGQRNDRCLQLILVGQPELAERLKRPALRQLYQRISARTVLGPLNSEEAREYVECRLRAKGGACADIFEPGALECLLRHGGGIPRNINVLCNNALLHAYVNRTKKVELKDAMATTCEYGESPSIVRETFSLGEPDIVADVLGARVERPERLRLPQKPALAIVAAFAVLLLFGFVHARTPAPAIQPPPASGPLVKQMTTGESAKVVASPGGALVASHLVESEASSAPQAPVPEPARAPEVRTGPASAAPAARVIAVTKEPSRPTALSEPRRQIKVRAGDTLEKLAVRYCGSRIGINDLMDANPQLTNINRLSVGQTINIPSDDVSAERWHNYHSLISPTEFRNPVGQSRGDGPAYNSSGAGSSEPTVAPKQTAANAGTSEDALKPITSADNHAVDAAQTRPRW
jgi:type II secretory pathway predicted ATPase ExeA/LysM repeat protein